MDANDLLNFVKELNDELDSEWNLVLERQNQLSQYTKKALSEAHDNFIKRINEENKAYYQVAIPEFQKEAESVKINYEKQRNQLENLYSQKWDRVKASIKSMLMDYLEKE